MASAARISGESFSHAACTLAAASGLCIVRSLNACWSRPEDVTGYPAYDRDPLPSSGGALGGGRAATLLGDAAHPMSPFKGQGANQALLDAVGLACAVRRAAPFGGERRLADCLGEYEEEMLPAGDAMEMFDALGLLVPVLAENGSVEKWLGTR